MSGTKPSATRRPASAGSVTPSYLRAVAHIVTPLLQRIRLTVDQPSRYACSASSPAPPSVRRPGAEARPAPVCGRLLPHPHGFEGFSHALEHLDPNRLAVAEGAHE